MGLVELDRMEPRMMESMEEMGEKMTAVLRAELQSTEVQLSHWVAEREQRLGDMQVCFSQEKSPVLACCPASLQGTLVGGGGSRPCRVVDGLCCGRRLEKQQQGNRQQRILNLRNYTISMFYGTWSDRIHNSTYSLEYVHLDYEYMKQLQCTAVPWCITPLLPAQKRP